VVCSWKSQCPTMQAVSTNRRSCSSPKAPRRMPAQRREGCRLGAHSRLRRPAPELLGDVAVGVLAGRSMASPGHQPPTDSPSGRTRATKAVALGQLSQDVSGHREASEARSRNWRLHGPARRRRWPGSAAPSPRPYVHRASFSSPARARREHGRAATALRAVPRRCAPRRPRTGRLRLGRRRGPPPRPRGAGPGEGVGPRRARRRGRRTVPISARRWSCPDSDRGLTTTRSPPHPTEGGVRTRRPAPGVVAAGGRPHPGRAPAPARSSASEAAAVDRDPLVGPRTAPRRHEEAHETATSSGVQTWPNGLPGPGGERRRPTHPSLALPPHLRDPPARRDHVDVHAVGALLRARCGRGLHGGLGML